jgi:hypothetical protein
MPRPILIDFRDDGTVDIDKSVYAMAEIQQLASWHGKQYVEVLVRLHAYRTPINPFSLPEERLKRAIADTKAFNKNCQIKDDVFQHRFWPAAVKRFNEEKYDPLHESVITLETKIDEFNRAIAATPVIVNLDGGQPGGRTKRKTYPGKARKSDAVGDPVEDMLDSELEDEASERRIDNTKLLMDMNKALREYSGAYEENRQKLLKVSKGKGALPMRVADLRKSFSTN